MPRFERALVLLGLAACHAAPAEVLFGLEAHAGRGAAGVLPLTLLDAGAGASAQDSLLRVWIDVGNAAPRCGECTEINAHASGGIPPYTFFWSEPSLLGPGPHTVCPNTASAYLVVVADARGTVVNTATATLPCGAAKPAPAASGATGMAPDTICFGRAPTELGLNCQTDAVGLAISRSIALSQPMTAGMPHSALLALQGLQATLANGMGFRLYGARSGCQPEQLLGTFQLSESVSAYGACFVPEHAYDHVIAVADLGSLALSVVDGMSFCNVGCAPVGE